MNFLEKIKRDLEDPRNRRGLREKAYVDSRALRELLHHFEALDSLERLKYSDTLPIQEGLAVTLEALYRNNDGNVNAIMLVVMETLQPLIKEDLKQKAIDYQYGGFFFEE